MATNYDAYMAGAYGVSAVGNIASAFAESEAIKAQASFQRTLAQINARLAGKKAESVIKAGDRQASQIKRKGEQVVGSQRAAAAAQGLDVTDGSVQELLMDTEMAVQEDVMTAKNNAWREAWGIKTQANFSLLEADQRSAGAKFAASQTLLTGGLKALESGLGAAGRLSNMSNPDKKIDGPSGSMTRDELDNWFDQRRIRR